MGQTETREEHPRIRDAGEAPGGSGAGEVFLSPRVIDRSALEAYGAQLRGLIAEADVAAEALRARVAEADRAEDVAQGAARRQRGTLETAAKILRALNAQADEARAITDRLEVAAERAMEDVDRLIAERLERAERRLDERMGRMERALASIERRRAEAEARLREAIDENIGLLSETYEQASRLAGWDPEHVEDGVGLEPPTPGSLGDMVERGERAVARLERVRTGGGESVDRLAGAIEESMRMIESLESRREQVVEAERKASKRAERVGEAICERLGRIEGAEHRVAGMADDIEARAAEAQRAADAVRETVDHAREAAASIEPLRAALPGPTPDADAVAKVAERVRAALGGDLRRAAAALASAAAGLGEGRAAPAAEAGEPEVVVREVGGRAVR
jgi:colicin import membrane protein